MNKTYPRDFHNSDWRFLYRLGGAAALIAVIFFRRNLSAEFSAFNGFGIFKMPQTESVSAGEWFALLNSSRFVGLVYLGLTDLVNYLLVGLLFLALGAALRKTNRGAVFLALSLAWAGIIIFFTTNQAFSLLSLAEQFASATGDGRRSLLLAAGEALLAVNNPGRVLSGLGSLSALLLVTLAALTFSVLMLRSDAFNKASAWVGILSAGFQLLYFPFLFLAPDLVALPFVLSAPFRVTWYVLAAIKLFKLAR
jgi:hypothetical protein